MDKDFAAAFLKFLDTASPQEIADRLERTKALLVSLSGETVRADAIWLINQLEREQLSRSAA